MTPSMEATMKIIVQPVDYCTDPPDLGGRVQVHSFNRRHVGYKDPDNFGLVVKDGRLTSSNPGIRQRLDTGTAYILSCYEHSGVVWSLKGEGYQCRWDTAPVAGILFIERERTEGREARESMVRDFMKHWNAWCNGEVFDVLLQDNDGEIIDSAWALGYREVEEIIEGMKESNSLTDPEVVENW
jgi:hypothetical protein